MDRVEAQAEEIKAKDEVIAEQDKAQSECEEAKEAYKAADEAGIKALAKERESKRELSEAFKRSEERVRLLEKKNRGANERVKWMALGGAAALILTIILK